MGVEGVKIIVDGRERFITDEHGYYKLDQVLVFGRFALHNASIGKTHFFITDRNFLF